MQNENIMTTGGETLPFRDFITRRRAELLPLAVIEDINRDYREVWGPSGDHGWIAGEGFPHLKSALWMNLPDGQITSVFDILPQRIAAVRRSGSKFCILDVGSGADASFHSGYYLSTECSTATKYKIIVKEKPVKEHKALMDLISEWGFKAGEDVEFISVNGGNFALPKIAGLRPVTANIFYVIS